MAKSVYLKKLDIREAPGFRDGIRFTTGFSEGINLIFGPNASGKSTTAKVMRQLVTGSSDSPYRATGHLYTEDTDWEARLSFNGLSHSTGGEPVNAPLRYPAKETAHRYLLSIDELIKAEDQDLAERIYLDSVGGYSIDTALSKREYNGLYKANAAEIKELKNAENELNKLRATDEKLQYEKKSLATLLLQMDDINARLTGLTFWKDVAQLLQSHKQLKSAEAKLKDFPEMMRNLRETDAAELHELEKQYSEATQTIKQKIHERDLLSQNISSLGFAHKAPDEESVYVCDELLNQLLLLEDKIKHNQSELYKLEEECRENLQATFPGATGEQIRAIKLPELSALDELSTERLKNSRLIAENERRQQTLIEQLKGINESTVQTGSSDLTGGISALSAWIKEQETGSGLPFIWIISTTFTAILGILAAWKWETPGLLSIPFLLLLVYVAYRSTKQKKESGPSALRKEDYRKTGLSEPDSWEIKHVALHIEKLLKLQADAQKQQQAEQELRQLRSEAEDLQLSKNQLLTKTEQLRNALGTLPGFMEPAAESAETMRLSDLSVFWYAKKLMEWQQSDAKISTFRSHLMNLTSQFDNGLATLQKKMMEILPGREEQRPINTSAGATASVKYLHTLRAKHIQLSQQVNQLEYDIEHQQNIVDVARHKIDTLLNRLNCNPDNTSIIKEYSARIEEWNKALAEHKAALSGYEQLYKHIEFNPVFEYEINGLKLNELHEVQVEEKLRELESLPAERDRIRDRITEIETRITDARRSHLTEDAIQQKELAFGRLRERFEDTLRKEAGEQLAFFLKQKTHKDNVPLVLQKAKSIFSGITNGRYELEVNSEDKPSFSVLDRLNDSKMSLNALSGGTRIQLLLSVRLGYIEAQEQDYRFPIWCDELLANSDDKRAAAIIRSLIAINRTGRQVFYFTAQADEAEKWKRIADTEHNASIAEIYLNDNNHYSTLPEQSESATLSKRTENILSGFSEILTEQLPIPQKGESMEGYAVRAGIYTAKAPIQYEQPEKLPVAYLCSTADQLYALQKNGIIYAGIFESLKEKIIRNEILDLESVNIMSALYNLYKLYINLVSVGRNRRLYANSIKESNIISANFIDSVSDLLDACKGEPGELIYRLKKREIARFKNETTEKLETYLKENGFIDERNPLTEEHIIAELNLRAAQLKVDKRILTSFFSRITNLSTGKL
ncbi:MAG: hypothetical protein LAT67_07670 [Balneolales bacterium]|nr:hypothetical protein [Balneolales bacterium]